MFHLEAPKKHLGASQVVKNNGFPCGGSPMKCAHSHVRVCLCKNITTSAERRERDRERKKEREKERNTGRKRERERERERERGKAVRGREGRRMKRRKLGAFRRCPPQMGHRAAGRKRRTYTGMHTYIHT